MNPKYPIYIPSKGRYESRLTTKALEKLNVPYRIVIEEQEYKQYSAVIDPENILILPFSNLKKGSVPARNWIMEHSIKKGHVRHWQLDDNIRGFHRLNKNKKHKVSSGICFKIAEDFTDRYKNVAYSGLQYELLAPRKSKCNPFILNTRIYSCTLVNNSIPYRWRSIYNEDTDVCLMALKGGWCTILLYAFLADKMPTMTIKGGNTEDLYLIENGRLEMAKSLQKQHPDIVTITRKWGRWQHQVNYKPFKKNKLIRNPDVEIKQGIDNYGMRLVEV